MSSRDVESVESLVRPVIVVAVLLAVIQFVLGIVRDLLVGARIELVTDTSDQLIGIIGDAAFLAVILAIVVLGTTMAVVKWGSAVLFVAGFVEDLLFRVTNQFDIGIDLVVNQLYTVAFFLALVAVVRTYRGETVLPGVDITVDMERMRFERFGGKSH